MPSRGLDSKEVRRFLKAWSDIAITSLIAVMGGVATFVWAVDLVQNTITENFVVAQSTDAGRRTLGAGDYKFSRNWSFALAGTAWLLGSGTIFAVVLGSRRGVTYRERGQLIPYRDAYQACSTATFRIFNQLYLEAVPPKHHISEVAATITVESDGTTTTVEQASVRIAADEPLHFWKRTIESDPESDPVSLLSGLNFKVRDLDQSKGVTFLPVRDEEKVKEVCLFFLPEIKKGETRKLEIYWKWPKYLKRLIDRNEAIYAFGFSGRPGMTSKFHIDFIFSAKLGPVDCENQSPPGIPSGLTSGKNAAGDTTWTLSVPNAPFTGEGYQLRFTRPSILSTTAAAK